MSAREAMKQAALAAATVAVSPALLSYWIRSQVIGRDRALEGSSQLLALVPGISGQYLRRAFLGRVLAACHPSSTVECGTLFSQASARIDENAYVGPGCHLGSVHLERDVLLAAGVHVPSGRHTHGVASADVPIRDQAEDRKMVRIGSGTWIGAGAIVMADVGRDSIVGAGAVVTKPVPDRVLAAGVPAQVIRSRDAAPAATLPIE
jgi:acetyltransferase-like isoleucine patch superfamily enzyme